MQISIVTHNVIHGDGQGRVNYELVRRLLEAGIKVELIAAHVAPELEDEGATWIQLPHRVNSVDLVRVFDFSRRADEILVLRRERYDAVLACGFTLTVPHTINTAHFVHGTWARSPYHSSRSRPGLWGTYQWVYSRWNARWERTAFESAGVVVAVSEMVRDELLEIGVPKDKLEVVINGVDVDEYRPGMVDRAVLGLPVDVPLGIFVGDLRSTIKNLDGVLRALVEVPEAHLAVVGRLEGSPFPALAEELGLSRRVHFLGFRSEVATLMRAADFFTLPSRRDSCPLVLLEALASGLPVLTARTVGTAGLVADGAGVVVNEPDDEGALVKGMRLLVRDPVRRRTMSQEARRIAEAHSWDRMARRYLALIEREVGMSQAAHEPQP